MYQLAEKDIARLGHNVSKAILSSLNGSKRSPGPKAPQDERLVLATKARREAQLLRALSTPEGRTKFAQKLREPVKTQMEYKSICRNLAIVEPMSPGEPLRYDKDYQEADAVVVADKGTSLQVVMATEYVDLSPFQMVGRVKIEYADLYDRRFKAVQRAKERLIESIDKRYDLTFLALMRTAAALSTAPTAVALTGRLTKRGIAQAVSRIRDNRVPVGSIVGSAYMIQDVLTWNRDDFTPAYMEEALNTGYLGELFGLPLFVTDQVEDGECFVNGAPEITAWVPIRKDLEIIIADDPDNLWLGFVAYLRLGMTWHNSKGICRVTFNQNAA